MWNYSITSKSPAFKVLIKYKNKVLSAKYEKQKYWIYRIAHFWMSYWIIVTNT